MAGSIARMALTVGTDPSDQRSKQLRYRFWKEGAAEQNLIVRAFEAATELGSGTHLNVGVGTTQASFDMSGTVSNWGTLVVETEAWAT
jgi:uncharacterized protein involved in type VI secretion and phage assembly